MRNEDLRRYQTLILHALGYNTKIDPQKVTGDVKKKIKFYGQQASDRILRPEQVFRGFLVSTLMCQECHHTSSRHENFLDISLPVSQDKPQPPIRRKGSPDPADNHNMLIALPNAEEDAYAQSPAGSSKHQQKKERKKDKKLKRISRKQKLDRNGNVEEAAVATESQGGAGEGEAGVAVAVKKSEECNALSMGRDNNDQEVDKDGMKEDQDQDDDEEEDDSEDDTDADEEDNCQEDQDANKLTGAAEKQDDTPENPNKGDFDAKNLLVEVSWKKLK